MPTRPTSVPSIAVPIPPSVAIPGNIALGSALDPQNLAIAQFEAIVAYQNAGKNAVFLRALYDWKQNDSQYTANGLTGPPAPNPPVLTKANVVWADNNGQVDSAPITAPVGMTAWIWES